MSYLAADHRTAKPPFVGSNPTRASDLFNHLRPSSLLWHSPNAKSTPRPNPRCGTANTDPACSDVLRMYGGRRILAFGWFHSGALECSWNSPRPNTHDAFSLLIASL